MMLRLVRQFWGEHAVRVACTTICLMFTRRRYVMADIQYEIVKKIGGGSKAGSGWAKELNLISWNDREPKYDLRDWSADGTKMGKGGAVSKGGLAGVEGP